ncbi:hypothetical protein KSF_074740 [Reticulibacter mediterranei]|uniref:Uncharacterized protein n=1 Tax=Reticulibacter mediterranei TaxID=2778369 RepID=A0A8J3IWM2_9CHLR|nr:DUF6519 domain-containing protein [Reticulibacter mediterranei]GHO97426.1 hypothetical protein KSF_074740 [Reticulibacter mediterranei]
MRHDCTIEGCSDREDTQYLLYLDVWELEVISLEDDAIRESALGGPDTATRAEIVWQVKAIRSLDMVGGAVEKLPRGNAEELTTVWTQLLYNRFTRRKSGLLEACIGPNVTSTDPCITPPSSAYRGLENQLYRIEHSMFRRRCNDK